MVEFRRKLITLSLLTVTALAFIPNVNAVTKEEMDRARAVTAQWYLRWVNNGSDYLDNLNPQSMADLEGQLKDKEKENIKAFKSVGTPGDYASWDKDKVVEYWSTTFFQASGLNEKGKGARARVKKKLLALNFTDPSDMSKETAPAADEPSESQAEAQSQEAQPAAPAMPSAEEVIDQTNANESAVVADSPEEEPTKRESDSSSNWLYIVALIVLVGVVVWLVVFASKTMQNSSKASADLEAKEEKELRAERRREEKETREDERRREKERKQAEKRRRRMMDDDDDEEEAPLAHVASVSDRGENALREKFARTIAIKDEEIRGLHRQIHSLRDENMRLSDDNTRLNSELAAARRELSSFKGTSRKQLAEDVALETAPVGISRTQISQTEQTSVREDGVTLEERTSSTHRDESARKIYLGRVNSKGIFVRADRKPVEGKSVYALTTTDSYTGTFRVLQSSATVDMALDNPEHYLAGGCVAQDITATAEADGIRTIASGTAVFEDGCWRILRKAKIAYE